LLQESALLELPSSQNSPASRTPSVQKAVSPGAVWQLALQTLQANAPYGQISVNVLPSSHPSPTPTIPLPQPSTQPFETSAKPALQAEMMQLPYSLPVQLSVADVALAAEQERMSLTQAPDSMW
jgi:hypothetical protein